MFPKTIPRMKWIRMNRQWKWTPKRIQISVDSKHRRYRVKAIMMMNQAKNLIMTHQRNDQRFYANMHQCYHADVENLVVSMPPKTTLQVSRIPIVQIHHHHLSTKLADVHRIHR